MVKEYVKREDITSSQILGNDTWNDCPECGRTWKDDVGTKGLIHRTRLCHLCSKKPRLVKEYK